jgi:hypothetical protein
VINWLDSSPGRAAHYIGQFLQYNLCECGGGGKQHFSFCANTKLNADTGTASEFAVIPGNPIIWQVNLIFMREIGFNMHIGNGMQDCALSGQAQASQRERRSYAKMFCDYNLFRRQLASWILLIHEDTIKM